MTGSSCQCKRSTVIVVTVFVVIVIFITAICLHVPERNRLCPHGELFYKAKGECFKMGAQGPCNDTIVLEEIYPKSQYGGCSCAYSKNERALLYHQETNKCYFIFSQGFCEDGFWINIRENGKCFCEKNICLDKIAHEVGEEVVPLQGGSCAILNKKAKGCVYAVQFVQPNIYPFCPTRTNKIKLSFGSVGVVPYTPCRLGSFRNIMGICTPILGTDIIFNFN